MKADREQSGGIGRSIPSSRFRTGEGVPALPPLSLLLAAAFFLSGASALAYELLWFRMLGHIFGSTATATATLLAAYLFGLGLGAWIFGRISDRSHRLALIYVAIEVGIGLYGLASHALLERSAILYTGAHAWAAGDPGRLLALRFAVSFLLIVIPTTLMGGTFPLMVQLLRDRSADAGRATARAYAVNTAGAALGAIALPILILPHLGIALSLVAAAASNLTAALCVFLFARRPGQSRPEESPRREETPTTVPSPPPASDPGFSGPSRTTSSTTSSPIPLLAGFLLSSFAALSLETAWSRHFGIFFGSQIYTFAFILFAYLVGLFLGGVAYARFAARGVAAGTLLKAGFLLTAISVGVTIPFLDRLPVPQIALMSAFGVSHASFVITSALQTLLLVLPPALGFGIAFPSVVALLAARGRRTGASVALTYAVNTLGTTLGAIGAGFVLIPAVGSQRTFEISVLLVAAALALTSGEDRTRRPARGLARPLRTYGVPAAFLILLVLPRWDWRFAHGMYSKDPATFVKNYRSGELATALATYRVPFLEEGTEATVSVLEFGDQGRRSLFINGKPDASDIPDDMVVQRLLGLVPGLFHHEPKDALVIGLGSGTTVATLKRFPLTRLESAEIAPGVVRAAERYFVNINDRFWEDPRVFLRLDDGRNYLHFRPAGSYDLIVSEPSNPWTAGVSALFTDEFFAEAKDRLRTGGVLVQWFHYYNMSLDHVRLIVRTFIRHFPETAVFVALGDRPTGDLLLVGTKGTLRLDRLPDDPTLPEGVASALAEIKNSTPEHLLRGLVAGPEDVAALAGQGALNTDDLPTLEFEAPADRFKSFFTENLRALLTVKDRIFLAAGPTPEEANAESQIRLAGFAPPRGKPDGNEERRGATVLTRQRPGVRELDRWVLLGSEFVTEESRTGLYRLTRPPARTSEIRDIAQCLAGSSPAGEGTISVNGHPGLWLEGKSEREPGARIVVCAWSCPVLDRAFFVSRQVPITSMLTAEEIARSLAADFPCAQHP